MNNRLPISLLRPLLRPAAWLGRLLPQDCQLCSAASGAALLCGDCRMTLPRLQACCPQCAMPSVSGEVCGRCLKRPPHFDATLAALCYAFPSDRLILALKFGARLPIAVLLADLLLERIHPEHCDANAVSLPDVLVPMPLHPARLASRGFNQAAAISRRLGKALHRPVVMAGVVRVRDTALQTELPVMRRRANVRGAFDCHIDLSGRTVAIVDDVMTTGATLDELARVLKRAGAVHVENWVAARTWPEANTNGASGV